MKTYQYLLVFFALLCASASAPVLVSSQDKTPQITASTSWTAALAQAAGAKDITILAPFELKHPPEYELKPSELTAVSSAGLVVFAGYERFAKKLAETAGAKTLRVVTVNDPASIKAAAKSIAEKIGTLERYEKWAKDFDLFSAEIKTRVLAAYPDRRAVVHKMQRPFAEWLGLDIVGEYGPAEPSPALVLELVRKHPALVIDNYHNPSGFPIAEAVKARYAALVNFPGKDGSRTVEDVFRLNADCLVGAKRQ